MELNRAPDHQRVVTKVKDEKTDEDTENLAWLLLDNALMQAASSPRMWMPPLAAEDYSGGLAGVVDLLPEMEVPDDPEEEEDDEDEVTWTRGDDAEGRRTA